MKPSRFLLFLLFVSTFLLVSLSAKAQTSTDWVWAKHDNITSETKGMALDSSGNIYTVNNLGLIKRGSTGNIIWQLVVHNTSQIVYPTAVSTDPLGNVFITGYFLGTAFFDTISVTSRGQKDIFLAKFNPQGKVFWVRTGGGTGSTAPMPGSIDDVSYALAIDGAGNSYIAGKIHTLGTSVFFDSVTIPPFSGSGFGAKYDTNGKIKWVWMLGVQGDESMKVASGPQGSVYYSWNAGGTAVSRFNADGSVAWHKPFPTTAMARINGLGVDQTGSCFFTGDFQGNFTFGSTTLTAASGPNSINFYVAKYDASGNPIWATQSTGGAVTPENLTLDQQGHPHITGNTNGNVNFGPNLMLSTTNEDVFAMKFNTLNGAPVWGITGGSNGADTGQHIKPLLNGDCIVAGKFQQAATFGNSVLQPSQPNFTGNAFLAKISLNPLGMSKTDHFSNLQLYPNPANTEVNLLSGNQKATEVEIYSLTGQQVFRTIFQGSTKVNLAAYPAGIYLIKISSEDKTETRKLVLNH